MSGFALCRQYTTSLGSFRKSVVMDLNANQKLENSHIVNK